jgi:hypothetical protein
MALNYTTLTTTALGFTVALAWNNAVSQSLKSFYPPQNEKAAARHTIIYALVITIFVIFVVAVVDHTRKFVYKCTVSRGAVQDNMRAQRAPGAQSLSPIVRLWEPPHNHAPAH